jgi:peptidoglycan-associated lipoprotein
MQSFNRLGLPFAVFVSIFLGACSNTPVAPEAPKVSTATPAVSQKSAPSTAASNPIAKSPIAAHLDPASPLMQKRSVYFEFDQSVVSSDYAALLELHGKYLVSHPTVTIKIEGNTDEQGGAEYNLALGQRRADAVLSALKIYGAKDTQMEAVSFGKEKPREVGHEETAYKKNRRADLVYPNK